MRFLKLAKEVSTWSKDPSTKVGAAIVDDNKQVISLGYNGFAKDIEDTDERYADRENTKYKIIIHSEENAILFAERSRLKNSSLYVWPLMPCARCAAKIVQVGIKRVVAKKPDFLVDEADARWERDFALTKEQFEEAKVDLVLYTKDCLESLEE